MTAPHAPLMAETADKRPVTVFGPDFPFPFDDWIKHPSGLAPSRLLVMARKWPSSAPACPAWWPPMN